MIGDAIYTREEFLKQPVDFRIGGIISDGQWYSFPKWKMMSNCTEEELSAWIPNGREVVPTTPGCDA